MAMAGSERRLSNLDIFPPGELPLKKGIQGRAAGRNRPLALDHQFELGASGTLVQHKMSLKEDFDSNTR
jgi:hypothetical protein